MKSPTAPILTTALEPDPRVLLAHLHQGGGLASAGIGHATDGVLTAQHPPEIQDNLPLLSSVSGRRVIA